MLVLTRRKGESVVIGDGIRITVEHIHPHDPAVRFVVEVPQGVEVSRDRSKDTPRQEHE